MNFNKVDYFFYNINYFIKKVKLILKLKFIKQK
jgi:hypothetical protein